MGQLPTVTPVLTRRGLKSRPTFRVGLLPLRFRIRVIRMIVSILTLILRWASKFQTVIRCRSPLVLVMTLMVTPVGPSGSRRPRVFRLSKLPIWLLPSVRLKPRWPPRKMQILIL